MLVGIGVLLYFVFQENKLYFLVGEFVMLLMALIAYNVFRNVFRPIDLVQRGTDSLSSEDFNIKFSKTGYEQMDNLVEVYNSMIDKIRSERVYQQEQHYFLSLLLDALPIGVFTLDYDDNISEFNPAAKQMLELSNEDVGKSLADIDHEIGSELAEIEIGQSVTTKTGGINYFRMFSNRFMHRGFPRKFVLVQELSGEILETEKNAYGRVIRMMAHEVNNSMGAVNSILQSISSGDKINTDEIEEYLPIVIERNQSLTMFMKNFAKVVRLPKPTLEQLNVNELVGNVAQIMSVQASDKQIKIEVLNSDKPLLISGDKDQLQQALINIVLNAIQAIDSDNGLIEMRIDSKARQLQIIDNGKGIDDGNEGKLFTPFFSTKPDGQGIGLTLIREILHNHNAEFSLKSEAGRTTFEINF